MSRKYTLKEVGSGYRRERADWQTISEGISARRPSCPRNTQYILPWKQVGTLSFPLKAWNLVGFTELFLKSQEEFEFFANVSNIFQLFQHNSRTILILQKDETIFCKKFFLGFITACPRRFRLLRLSVLRLRFQLSSLICPPVPTYLRLLHHHCFPL